MADFGIVCIIKSLILNTYFFNIADKLYQSFLSSSHYSSNIDIDLYNFFQYSKI